MEIEQQLQSMENCDKKFCPICRKQLVLNRINFQTAIYMCLDLNCRYPVGFQCMTVDLPLKINKTQRTYCQADVLERNIDQNLQILFDCISDNNNSENTPPATATNAEFTDTSNQCQARNETSEQTASSDLMNQWMTVNDKSFDDILRLLDDDNTSN